MMTDGGAAAVANPEGVPFYAIMCFEARRSRSSPKVPYNENMGNWKVGVVFG